MAKDTRAGLVIAGGGLAGCLAALALAKLRPEVPVLLFEESDCFGGDHLWSFMEGAIADDHRWLIESMISQEWSGYYVSFPEFSRKLRTGYASIHSGDLDRIMRETLRPDQYRLNTKVVGVRDNELILPGGEKIRADGVIDARGAANLSTLDVGWCKSLAQDYAFARPHRLDLPVMIDATVDQDEGFHFVHCLPLSDNRLMIEDSYYSTSNDCDPKAMRASIQAYLELRGWRGGTLEDERAGTSPIAIGDDVRSLWRRGAARVAKLGPRGGFFHPANGHALADAVHTALLLAEQRDFDGTRLHDLFEAEAVRLWRRRDVYRAFNAVLFGANVWERRHVMEKLWRLEPGTLARFHCDQMGMVDRRRILGVATLKPDR